MARKILLADDSVTAQNMGRKILSDAGYDVVTVNNGSAALKRVAEQKPDLIVLDVYMPGYSGLEVCQRLKDSPDTEEIPVLLTVGKLEPFKPEEARRVRAEAYIVKPFEASELLSALTRLEDQMVPGHGKNGKSEGHGDSETGWKNRLRFPSKKKKEEPEAEPEADFAGGSNYRDTRRNNVPAPAASTVAEKNEPPAAAIPEIPRDITPEELDALSALAAKLDGEAAAAQPSAQAAKAAPSEARKEFEVATPAVEEKSAVIPAAQAEAPAAPAEEVKPAEETPAEPAPAVAEAKQPEPVPVCVETLAEKEPAPVEREDEPLFATAPVAAEPVAAEKIEVKPAEAAGVESAAPVGAPAPVEIEAKAEEPKTAEPAAKTKPAAETAPAESPKVEASVPAPASAATQAQEEQESPAPSEEELAEALRLLTPSATDSTSMPPQETLASAGAVLAREAARNATTTPQWMAVAVAVDPADAALSLEEEMFKTLAHPAANGEGASPSAVTATSAEEAGSSATSVETSAPRQESNEIQDAAPAEETAAATFAEAVRQDDEAAVSAGAGMEAMGKDSGAEAGLPVADTPMGSISNAATGGEEDMSKENGKSGKSNWHQIRSAAPAAKDPLEAAKQAEPEAAPKAMAAAANGARVTAADPTAIANIVDSVLADLRPKIVEEISKKLAGK